MARIETRGNEEVDDSGPAFQLSRLQPAAEVLHRTSFEGSPAISDQGASGVHPTEHRLESTQTLLRLVHDGDAAARDRLVERFLPALRAWARGRTPRAVRRLADTDDLVQITFLRTLRGLDRIRYRHPGAFFAYLRTALLNQIKDRRRQGARHPGPDSLPADLRDEGPAPVEVAIAREELERFDRALDALNEKQRAAVTLRVEFGCTFQEVADAVGCPSANAARMLVSRAIVRLSEVMDEPGA